MTALPPDDTVQAFDEQTWREVVAAMDRTYSELVDYQERLEAQNRELDEMRRFMASVLSSISELLIVVDRSLCIERTGGRHCQHSGAHRRTAGRDAPRDPAGRGHRTGADGRDCRGHARPRPARGGGRIRDTRRPGPA